MISLSDISTINEQMVEVPGGAIELRDDRIKHQWTVEIAPFLLAPYTGTQDVYFAITKASPSTFKGDKRPVETVWIYKSILGQCQDGASGG